MGIRLEAVNDNFLDMHPLCSRRALPLPLLPSCCKEEAQCDLLTLENKVLGCCFASLCCHRDHNHHVSLIEMYRIYSLDGYTSNSKILS